MLSTGGTFAIVTSSERRKTSRESKEVFSMSTSIKKCGENLAIKLKLNSGPSFLPNEEHV